MSRKLDFAKNVRPEFKDLLIQEQITYDDLDKFRSNWPISAEEFILAIKHLDTDGLIKITEAHMKLADIVHDGTEPETPEQLILQEILPQLIARIKTYEDIKDRRNRKKIHKSRNEATDDYS